MRIKSENAGWVGILAIMVGAAALAGASAAPLLVFMMLITMIFALVDLQPRQMVRRMRRAPIQAVRMSTQAKEAVERARRRGGYANPNVTLLDIGLITMESSREGMTLRRTRSVSKDDDGVRPFISLHVLPEDADRYALLRFEINDHNGQQQYVYEMKKYLQDGEQNVLADNQLPLSGNGRIIGAGDWTLRLFMDDDLVGVHSFNLAPSVEERRRHFTDEGEVGSRLRDYQEEEEDIPMSLEDLLRNQQRDQRG